jgi:hypothetical protein
MRLAVLAALLVLLPELFLWGWTVTMQLIAYCTWVVLIASLGHPALLVDADLLLNGEIPPAGDQDNHQSRRAARLRLYVLLGATLCVLVVVVALKRN